jgi:glucose-6-phosphate 1-dehydrogenase
MIDNRTRTVPVRVANQQEQPTVSAGPRPAPAVTVIFGASGDLARRKLIPALYALHVSGQLPESLAILGNGRTEMTDDEFAETMAEACRKHAKVDRGDCAEFRKRLFYLTGDPRKDDTYTALQQRIDELDERFGAGGNVLYYMSIPPRPMQGVVEKLKDAGMTHRERTGGPFTRIVIEKPFGYDLDSALDLDAHLHEAFREDQIFRIDHYLGKETVQNIMVFRFANSLFEPIWNRKYIDYVEITAAEPLGVEGRGGFYEQTGIMRDMVQNHLMQLLTLVAMEQPLDFSARSVRDERVKVIRSLRPIEGKAVFEQAVRGQYGPGKVDGEEVMGYREEKDVAPDSGMPTFGAIRAHIDNWRWQGVPFYIRAGKRLARKMTSIAIHFQPIPVCFFGDEAVCSRIRPNVLRLRIQPDEGIRLTFASKVPGEHLHPATVAMDFDYRNTFGGEPPDAYERLLLDCLKGDATLFSRQDEIEASWRWVTPILEAWAGREPKEFPNYDAGGEGPDEASRVLEKGHRWTPLGDH